MVTMFSKVMDGDLRTDGDFEAFKVMAMAKECSNIPIGAMQNVPCYSSMVLMAFFASSSIFKNTMVKTWPRCSPTATWTPWT